jgi:uncharacterized damage-inducible protein DinB
MLLNQLLIDELKQEGASTRKLLERVPLEKSDWTPHAKSMPLGKLAMHVAEITSWVTMIMMTDELDFTKFDYKLLAPTSVEDLLNKHDELVAQAIAVLEGNTNEDFEKNWVMRNGAHIVYNQPKYVMLRRFAFSHLFHHRAQLSLYLRLLDMPIPGMYGPTADER